MVNMTSPELRGWLEVAPDGDDAYPPEPGVDLPGLGRGVLHVLQLRRTDLTDHDIDVMRRVTDLIAVRLDNRPVDDVNNSPWRHSLMTVGHDPLKEA